jgi:putative spermidine/putrescine transport system ATP-binding protein
VVNGRDLTRVPPHRRDMGIVFQSYALFPHMSVAGNVGYGLKMRNVGRAEIDSRVRDAIAMVRLTGMEDHRPAQLSGGQQQRVALARALVIRPSILLLDEPLSNLDAQLRDEMRTEIRDIQQRLGITTIFVTHDQVEALAMCDRIAVMRAGSLEQLGTPFDIYEHPATPFVADFVGRINRLDGARDSTGDITAGALRLRAATPGPAGPVTVMMRPHRIQIAEGAIGPEWNSANGTVHRATYVGDVLSCDVDCAGTTLTVERHTHPGLPIPRTGEAVRLTWRVSDTLAFDA